MNAENKELLALFEPLRVADVRDGMDWMGYHHYGTMDHGIRPIYRTKAVGIARTARYLPFEGPVPNLRGEEYTKWSGWYYGNVATYPWMEEIEEGDFIALDVSGVDVGLMGSANALSCKIKARGASSPTAAAFGIRMSASCKRSRCGAISFRKRWTNAAFALRKRTCPWPSAGWLCTRGT